MKITHICLAGPFTDNWAYQENLLTKYHKKLGHDVTVITSQWIWGENGKLVEKHETNYMNENEVRIIRIKLKGRNKFNKIIKRFIGLEKELKKSNPEVVFVHGCQFVDINIVRKFVKKNSNVITFIDNHADFSNSAKNWVSKNLLHKLLWRYYAQKMVPYTKKFYGVLPSRVDFLTDMYKIPLEKADLLLMGVDDEVVENLKKTNNKDRIRAKHNIGKADFLIVSGGKIDSFKRETLTLMRAIKEIPNKQIKLMIFGSIDESLLEEFNDLIEEDKILYVGWMTARKTYSYFDAADLVVFPGRHSVMWEQVVGQGIPLVVKYMNGISHLDLGGNVQYFHNDSKSSYKKKVMEIYNNGQYLNMRKTAASKGIKKFSYKEIAKKSIEY